MNAYDKCQHGKRLDDRCDACTLLDRAERRRDAELSALRRVAEAAQSYLDADEHSTDPALDYLTVALARLKQIQAKEAE